MVSAIQNQTDGLKEHLVEMYLGQRNETQVYWKSEIGTL